MLEIFTQLQKYFPNLALVPADLLDEDDGDDPGRYPQIVISKRGISYGVAVAMPAKRLNIFYGSLGKPIPSIVNTILDLANQDELMINVDEIIKRNISIFFINVAEKIEEELSGLYEQYPIDINILSEYNADDFNAMYAVFYIDNTNNKVLFYEYAYVNRDAANSSKRNEMDLWGVKFKFSPTGEFLEAITEVLPENDEAIAQQFSSVITEDIIIPEGYRTVYSLDSRSQYTIAYIR
jgi:hypothetical protein